MHDSLHRYGNQQKRCCPVFVGSGGGGGDLICNVDIDQISDDFTQHNELLLTSEAVGTKFHLFEVE